MITLEELYAIYLRHPEVSTDSRRIPKDGLFFALRGERFDGNAYAEAALSAGAAYAIIDDPIHATDERMLLVEDSLHTLQLLAAHHRDTLGLPVIAITGTNGKTTTKELTAAVLAQSYDLLYTEGNLNNHIGVPLTLLRLRSHHQLALIEMGASKPGDIAELTAIAHPNYGLITNIGQAHLEGFGSLEGVRRTKGELYEYLRLHDGIIFYNADDATLTSMSEGETRLGYSTAGQSTVQGALLPHADEGLFLRFRWSAETLSPEAYEVTTQLVGDYNLPNALAAVTIGTYFDVPPAKICEALSQYTPSNSRSQFMRTSRGNRVIADAYNANPSSMRTALTNFLQLPPADLSRVAILGDMNELGSSSHEAHASLFAELTATTTPPLRLLLCGPEWQKVADDKAEVFPSVEELLPYLEAHPLQDSLILVKGSNGIHLGKLLPAL